MIRRLLTLLLLLALAAPAVAMSGHCALPAAASTMQPMHGSGHGHAPASAERRDCVGCVLPIADSLRILDAAALPGTRQPSDGPQVLVPVVSVPDTPPPRA